MAAVDSKVVDRFLREELWSGLKSQGFNRRTGRTAWRDHGNAVQCVNVQSFNSYLAERMGATTYSFTVNLGVFYQAIALYTKVGSFVRDPRRPKEYECQLRRFVTKGFAQPNLARRPTSRSDAATPLLGDWQDRPDVWFVLPDGSNVEAAVHDASERVRLEGLPWLDAVSEEREAIRRFIEEPDVFGPGAPHLIYGGSFGSPSRWQSIAALAVATKDWDLLRNATDEMSKDPWWQDHRPELDRFVAELPEM